MLNVSWKVVLIKQGLNKLYKYYDAGKQVASMEKKVNVISNYWPTRIHLSPSPTSKSGTRAPSKSGYRNLYICLYHKHTFNNNF